MVRVCPMASVIFEYFALGTFCIDFIVIGSFGFLTITISRNVLLDDTSVTWLCSIVVMRLSCKQEIGGSNPPRASLVFDDFAVDTFCIVFILIGPFGFLSPGPTSLQVILQSLLHVYVPPSFSLFLNLSIINCFTSVSSP